MNYEIFSYGNVDALAGLFNALAAAMNSGTFMSAIALVVVVGFFAAFLAFALAPERMAGPKWLVSVVLIYLVLFVPKATVHVVDKTGYGPPGLIDNVPLGLAAQAGVVSSIGSTLTDLFETALTVLPGPAGLPAEMTFTNNGLMFGARMVERSRKMVFDDPRTRADVANYFRNCTFYDISQGFIPASVFSSSTDIWSLAADTNPARFTGVTNLATNIVEPLNCPSAYAALNLRIGSAVNSMLRRLGLEMNPALQLTGGAGLPDAAALIRVTDQLPVAYARAMIGSAADSAASLVLQNAMINAVGDASKLASQAQNDPTAMLMHLARAQAATQLNSQSIASASMMSEALPLIRNGIEAMLYGLFPFVLLLALVFGGVQAVQMLKSYALALAWIALWPPIYAIVNYLGTLAWIKKAAAAAYLPASGATGMTLATANPIVDATISSMSTMGNMVLAVPMIAGAVVFGLNKITGMAMTMSQAVTSATGPIANQTAIGNVSAGNVQFQHQALGPNRSSAFMESFSDVRGTATQDVRDGEFRYTQNIGRSAVSLGSSTEIASRASEASGRSHAAGLEQSRAAERSTAGAFSNMLEYADSRGTGTTGNAGYTHSNGVGLDHSISKAMEVRDAFARSLGIADSSTASRALSVALAASTPGGALTGVRAELAARGESRTDEQISAAINDAQTAARSKGIGSLDKLTENYVNSEDFRHLSKTDQGMAERISAEVRSAQAYRQGASASFREADEYRQTAELVQSAAFSGKIDWTPEAHKWMKEYRPDLLGASGQAQWEGLVKGGFFHEVGIGMTQDGRPALSLYDGFGPGNITRHPVGFESDANADAGALRAKAASADVGGSHGSAAAFGLGSQSTVRAAADEGIGGPAPTDDAKLRAGYETSRQQAIDDYNAKVAAGKKQWTEEEFELRDRIDERSFAHSLTGATFNPLSENPAVQAAERAKEEASKNAGTDGGRIRKQ
ncbi:conjugal transfer protein TraG N-terminal domain-containing protein [Thauera butanivorans]|uniref:conjugal transfer protein TraG N-terminal domain-containing protein n=1 Tax=Thauera butanivorans TaxID=86174 RepID=UPI0008396673|nr:conjugal transfer protein TraG N-terminal domain-containing protein [Thauera butanivorans]